MSAETNSYTDADVRRAVDAIDKHREWSENWASDTALCIATDILPAVAPAIAARAIRDAARDLERRSGLFKLRPSDKVRRQTHADIAGHLRARADEIEAGR